MGRSKRQSRDSNQMAYSRVCSADARQKQKENMKAKLFQRKKKNMLTGFGKLPWGTRQSKATWINTSLHPKQKTAVQESKKSCFRRVLVVTSWPSHHPPLLRMYPCLSRESSLILQSDTCSWLWCSKTCSAGPWVVSTNWNLPCSVSGPYQPVLISVSLFGWYLLLHSHHLHISLS